MCKFCTYIWFVEYIEYIAHHAFSDGRMFRTCPRQSTQNILINFSLISGGPRKDSALSYSASYVLFLSSLVSSANKTFLYSTYHWIDFSYEKLRYYYNEYVLCHIKMHVNSFSQTSVEIYRCMTIVWEWTCRSHLYS